MAWLGCQLGSAADVQHGHNRCMEVLVRQIVNPLMAHRRRADFPSQRLRSWNKHSHCSHRPRHLLAFRRAHTQIKIHLAIGNTAQVAAGVEAGSAERRGRGERALHQLAGGT